MLKRFGVSLENDLLDRFDELIREEGYQNRSEAIRDLIRHNLVESQWESSDGETAAAVVLVYDHHRRGLTEHLTGAQHEHHDHIIASMHAHLDHHNCMEVVLLRGSVTKVKAIADRLVSAKHVKLGRFVPATTGAGLA